MARPIFAFGATFLSMTALCRSFGLWPALALCLLLILFSMLSRLRPLFARDLRRAACAAFLCALSAVSVYQHRLRAAQAQVGKTLEFSGYVSACSDYNPNLKTVRAKTENETFLLQLYTYDTGIEEGDALSGSAQIYGVCEDSDDIFSGGLSFYAAAQELRLSEEHFGLGHSLARLRLRLTESIYALSPGDAAGMTVGLLFARSSYIGNVASDAVSRTGAGHILSVSGLHTAIVTGFVLFLCRQFGAGKKVCLVAGMGAVLLVCMMAGFRVPVLRAGLMTALTLTAGALDARSDGLTSLSLAASLMTAVSPAVLSTLSFQLSFSAAAGLILLCEPIAALLERMICAARGRCGKPGKTLIGAVSVCFSAQLGILPVMALSLGYLPVWSLPVNLLICPLVWPAVLLGTVGALLLLLPLAVPGKILLLGAMLICRGILAVCRFFDRLSGCVWPVQLPGAFLMVFGLTAAVLFWALRRPQTRRARRVLLLSLAGLVCVGGLSSLLSRSAILITAEPDCGAVVLRHGSDALLIKAQEGDYADAMAERLLLRTGFDAGSCCTVTSFGEAAALCTPWEGLRLKTEQDYLTEISCGGKKLLKLWAGYGIITEADLDDDAALLIDLDGNLYAPGGEIRIFTLPCGDRFAVLR